MKCTVSKISITHVRTSNFFFRQWACFLGISESRRNRRNLDTETTHRLSVHRSPWQLRDKYYRHFTLWSGDTRISGKILSNYSWKIPDGVLWVRTLVVAYDNDESLAARNGERCLGTQHLARTSGGSAVVSLPFYHLLSGTSNLPLGGKYGHVHGKLRSGYLRFFSMEALREAKEIITLLRL